jgi:UDP-N-acetylenolpyruvoylglucosamine reductase
MIITKNAPLSEHSTMRLGGLLNFYVRVESEDDLSEAIKFAKKTMKKSE